MKRGVLPIDRRAILRSAAFLGAGVASGGVWAAPQAGARLLVVFLRGAYDAVNVVIPTGSDCYYDLRSSLAIARPDKSDLKAALPLDSEWSLHPALGEAVMPLFNRREIAFVPFAGTDDVSRSHFKTQDKIELGEGEADRASQSTGFMARLAAELNRARPISFTDQAPLIFSGMAAVPNIELNAVRKPTLDKRRADLIGTMYEDTFLAEVVRTGIDTQRKVFETISDHLFQADRGAVLPIGFELSARRIGKLMREEFNLGFVDVGGWDTHVNQGAAEGYLATRLSELGRGIAGFVEEMGPVWGDSVIVVLSEFGRSFRENGSRGTDHGHGSVYWVLGGRVKGGRIAGPQVNVTRGNLFQDRDLPVLTDYRVLLSDLFRSLYSLSNDSLQRIFPGIQPRTFELI